MVTESLDQHPAASRRPSRAGTPQCGTPAERTLAPGCPGTPGTPGGPSPGGADLRGKALPHARGLSKLVRALQPCRQLPLAELAAWFGDGLGPPPGRFDELPPSDGFGGGYLPLRGEEVSAGFKTPPRSGSPCASPAVTFRSASFMSTGGRSASFLSTGGRSESFSSTGSRRRSSFSLFGRPSLDASRLQLPEPSGSACRRILRRLLLRGPQARWRRRPRGPPILAQRACATRPSRDCRRRLRRIPAARCP
ncbi:unnamed protein product, partial [Prorocentrum cordatum]